MTFTQPCFIRKNTPKLRTKLEELDYNQIPNGRGIWNIPIEELSCLKTIDGDLYCGVNGRWESISIDCGTNEELFLALAALRDDSDYMQWFVTEKGEWVKCEREHFYQEHLTKTWRTWHKATVEEIIEHFK